MYFRGHRIEPWGIPLTWCNNCVGKQCVLYTECVLLTNTILSFSKHLHSWNIFGWPSIKPAGSFIKLLHKGMYSISVALELNLEESHLLDATTVLANNVFSILSVSCWLTPFSVLVNISTVEIFLGDQVLNLQEVFTKLLHKGMYSIYVALELNLEESHLPDATTVLAHNVFSILSVSCWLTPFSVLVKVPTKEWMSFWGFSAKTKASISRRSCRVNKRERYCKDLKHN